MIKNNNILASLLLILFCINFTCFNSIAFGDAETGNQSGGGKGAPVEVKETYPANNAADVPVDVTIMFGFSKDVAHFSVNEGNRSCFSMTDSKGNPVPFKVIIADSQVEPEKRRDISIKPSSPLEPGENYSIQVSKLITSKSGDTLSDNYNLTFSTVKKNTSSSPTPAKPVTSNTSLAQPSKSNSKSPAATNKTSPSSISKTNTETSDSTNKTSDFENSENMDIDSKALTNDNVELTEDDELQKESSDFNILPIIVIFLIIIITFTAYIIKKRK